MSTTIRCLAEGEGPLGPLREAGARSTSTSSPQAFLQGLAEGSSELALVSFGAEGVDGAFLERVVEVVGDPGRVLVSAPGASLELAVLARRLGLGPPLREPLDPEEVRSELARRGPVRRGIPLADPDASSAGGRWVDAGPEMVGSGPAMATVVRAIAEVGDTPAAVLVTGESGTGKELVARAIHWSSSRRDGPFVAINCAAIPEHLLESEFFGHERGAFTGAVARKRGRFERAHGGTLFLDEVGDMSVVLQAKILRALEEGEIERVGGEAPLEVDARIVAATNRDLEEGVADGHFREDLLHRLAAARLHVPPLRERLEDLEELALHFAGHFAREYGRPMEGLDRAALRRMRTHPWAGNVRELRNVMDRAVRSCRGRWIRPEDLGLDAATPRLSARGEPSEPGYPPTSSLEEVERDHIARVLAFTGGAIGEAAELLGVHRNTLTRKIARHGIPQPTDGA